MYKVFVNERALLFSEKPAEDCKNIKYENASTFNIAVSLLESKSHEVITIYYHNIDKLWKSFYSHYKNIIAAGGIVTNEADEILFIKRLQKWDLPKGKVEKNESLEIAAVREIEEECGVEATIEEFIHTTYHIYKINEYILKETHWYKMKASSDAVLIPQAEEGIEKVEWKTKENAILAAQESYKNIKLLIEIFYPNNIS